MRYYHREEEISVKDLIEAQLRLSVSPNSAMRVVGSLYVAGLLRERLATLPDRAIGHLMFEHVSNEMPCLSPSMTILGVATDRLLGRAVEPGVNEELGGE
ncbi:MAG: hypothetical protein WBQ09_09745 [Terriglobales bacterium]